MTDSTLYRHFSSTHMNHIHVPSSSIRLVDVGLVSIIQTHLANGFPLWFFRQIQFTYKAVRSNHYASSVYFILQFDSIEEQWD